MFVSPLLEQPGEKVYLLRLDHRRRRLSRPHRLGIFDLQHVERISQAAVRRSRHFPRGFFADPLRRDSHRRCGGANDRHVDGPLGRALADGGGRFDFWGRLYLPGSGAGFHPVHAGALAADQPRRFVDGLHGGQRFNLTLVRAHARPRSRDRGHGPWLGQSLHAAGGGDLDALRRLARRLGGLRRFRLVAGGRAGLAVYAPIPGRNGIAAGRRTRGAESGSRNAKKVPPRQAHRRRQCRVEPARSTAHAGLLAHRQHLRCRPDRRHRTQSPCFFLCHRSRPSNAGGRVRDEHHRGHAAQHADRLGTRRPHG